MIAQSGERTAPAPRSPSVAPDPRFAAEVVAGLSSRPRSVPSRWLYDRRGSRLFQRITRLPEYYLTRCEEEILALQGGEVTRTLAGRPCTVVDLGAGDGHKTRLLLERLVAGGGPVSYTRRWTSPWRHCAARRAASAAPGSRSACGRCAPSGSTGCGTSRRRRACAWRSSSAPPSATWSGETPRSCSPRCGPATWPWSASIW